MQHLNDGAPARLKLPAVQESLDPFQDFVRGQIRSSGNRPASQFKIHVALEEALVNIARYAYPPGETGWIELACSLREGQRLCVEIRDGGRLFNPFERVRPDSKASPEQREVDGLGVFLIRQMAEKAGYRREGEINVMSLEFGL